MCRHQAYASPALSLVPGSSWYVALVVYHTRAVRSLVCAPARPGGVSLCRSGSSQILDPWSSIRCKGMFLLFILSPEMCSRAGQLRAVGPSSLLQAAVVLRRTGDQGASNHGERSAVSNCLLGFVSALVLPVSGTQRVKEAPLFYLRKMPFGLFVLRDELCPGSPIVNIIA